MNPQSPDIYKVDWIGKTSNSVFSKTFESKSEAVKFAKDLKQSLIFRLVKASEKAFQWQIVPTVQGQELIKNVNMRRELEKKGKLVNREGLSSIGLTPEIQKSQKARLIGMVIVPSVTIYSAVKYPDLPLWLRGALVSVGVVSFYVNGRNYLSNVKYAKQPKTKK